MTTIKNKSGNTGKRNSPSDPSNKPGERSENAPREQGDDLLYPHVSESQDQRDEADTSFSEREDVTPPNKRNFPSVGPAKRNFEDRPQGRTTGRMIGHEPGTEAV